MGTYKFKIRKSVRLKVAKFQIIGFAIMAVIHTSIFYSNSSTASNDVIRFFLRVIMVMLLGTISITMLYTDWHLGKSKINIGFFIPIAFLLFISINHYFGEKPTFALIAISVFMQLSQEKKRKIYLLFYNILVVASLIGIFCYISYYLNLTFLYKVTAYYSMLEKANYIDFGIVFLYRNSSGVIVRLCGFMNEPGLFGTLIALLLCNEKMNFKRKENIVLLIAGCLTFSVAFFIILFVYLALLCYKKPYLLVIMLLIILIVFFVLPNITIANSNIAKIVSRLQIVNGKLVGDRRTTTEFDRVFDQWKSSGKILFGYGHGYINANTNGGFLSYKEFFVDYGIIGFTVAYVPLFLYSIKEAKKNRYALYSILCFFLSVYQRPYIYTLAYFTILIGGIENILYISSSET